MATPAGVFIEAQPGSQAGRAKSGAPLTFTLDVMKGLVYIVGDITFADLEAERASPVDVHEAQVTKWLLQPAQHLASMPPSIGSRYEHGMSLFALELMFFEPHGQYLTGEDSNGRAGEIFSRAFERFRGWLISQRRVQEDFGTTQAHQVRDWARNGLFHSGHIKDGLLVDIRNQGKGPFYRNPVWDGWLVDPWQLLQDIQKYFAEYINVLRNPCSREQQLLLENFLRTFQRLVVAPTGAG